MIDLKNLTIISLEYINDWTMLFKENKEKTKSIITQSTIIVNNSLIYIKLSHHLT